MINNFETVMSKMTDAELFQIVTGPEGDYQAAAFEAAKSEFAKRNLSEDQFEVVKQEIEQAAKIKNEKANEPLELRWKILTFAFPGIVQLMFSGGFRIKGYNRKANEFITWTIFGFGFYIGLVLLIKFLNGML